MNTIMFPTGTNLKECKFEYATFPFQIPKPVTYWSLSQVAPWPFYKWE